MRSCGLQSLRLTITVGGILFHALAMKQRRYRLSFLLGFLPTLAILLLAPTMASPLDWRFEFADGTPVKLVWQTEEGRSYDLWWSDDLSSWTHVDEFPQAGTGGPMEHPFAPGARAENSCDVSGDRRFFGHHGNAHGQGPTYTKIRVFAGSGVIR